MWAAQILGSFWAAQILGQHSFIPDINTDEYYYIGLYFAYSVFFSSPTFALFPRLQPQFLFSRLSYKETAGHTTFSGDTCRALINVILGEGLLKPLQLCVLLPSKFGFNLCFSMYLQTLCFSDVFMEKHWKSVIHRSICDYFFEAQSKVCRLMYSTSTLITLYFVYLPGISW